MDTVFTVMIVMAMVALVLMVEFSEQINRWISRFYRPRQKEADDRLRELVIAMEGWFELSRMGFDDPILRRRAKDAFWAYHRYAKRWHRKVHRRHRSYIDAPWVHLEIAEFVRTELDRREELLHKARRCISI